MATRTIDKIKDLNGDINLLEDAEARALLGSDPLDTTAQTVTGAVNEINTTVQSLGSIADLDIVEVSS